MLEDIASVDGGCPEELPILVGILPSGLYLSHLPTCVTSVAVNGGQGNTKASVILSQKPLLWMVA